MSAILLPPGRHDLLPPFAGNEARLSAQLITCFERYGYEQVAPPLMEYTESLLSGRGAALAAQTFRLMDPVTNKVMGLRPDMTLQVGRIAATRLNDLPRPLRLSYAGAVLRMQPEGLEHSRQRLQSGIELIGSAAAEADAEVICVALSSLRELNVAVTTLDIGTSAIVAALLKDVPDDEAAKLRHAVHQRDTTVIAASSLPQRELLVTLMRASGKADVLEKLTPPPAIAAEIATVKRVAELVRGFAGPDLRITFDMTEISGYEYHTGLCFSLYGESCELGRGGRYRTGQENALEEATGLTLYIDALSTAPTKPTRRLYVIDAAISDIQELQRQGYATILALPGQESHDFAAKLRCEAVWHKGKITPR